MRHFEIKDVECSNVPEIERDVFTISISKIVISIWFKVKYKILTWQNDILKNMITNTTENIMHSKVLLYEYMSQLGLFIS